MGITSISTNIGKEIIAWTRTQGQSLLATRPIKVNTQALKYTSTLNSDVVQFSRNCYLTNIKKLGLNEKDENILKKILTHSEIPEDIQSLFNRVINNSNVDLNELKTLFSGKEVIHSVLKKKIWKNRAFDNEFKLCIILKKLEEGLQPKDLEIIKSFDNYAIEMLYENKECVLPNKYIKKLSSILKKDNSYICRTGKGIECFGKNNKKYFEYDSINGKLISFEEDGTQKLVKEIKYINDLQGKPSTQIIYESSDIEGVFNVIKRDLNIDKKVTLSEGFIDNTGKKIVKQNLISPTGTKSNIYYEEMPNGDIQYRYKIVDKEGSLLLNQIRSRKIINDSEFEYAINDKSYNVKFIDLEKIEILNKQTNELETINLQTLLSDLTKEEKAEILAMLKRVSADELLTINKLEINKLLKTSINAASTTRGSSSIATFPNEFVFLHELGHKKDVGKNVLSTKDKELATELHELLVYGLENKEVNNLNKKTSNIGPEDFIEIFEKAAVQNLPRISTNKKLIQIYNKERAEFIKKFGTDEHRLDYFIRQGSELGYEGETIAEINALLSTPISESALETRSYLLAENFPETIAYARNLL